MGIFTESIKKNLGISLPIYTSSSGKNVAKIAAKTRGVTKTDPNEHIFSRNRVYTAYDNTNGIEKSSETKFSAVEKSEKPRFSLSEEDVEYISAQVERDSRRYSRRF